MIPKNIDATHVERAMAFIDANGIPAGRESTSYEVARDGKRYPVKYLLGRAAFEATGRELPFDEFSSDKGTRERLTDLGFTIVLRETEGDEFSDDADADVPITKADALALLEEWFPIHENRVVAANLFAEAIETIHAVGASKWSTGYAYKLRLSVNAGRSANLALRKTGVVALLLDEPSLPPEARTAVKEFGIRRSDRYNGLFWRFDFSVNSLPHVLPLVRDGWHRVITRAANAVRQTPRTRGHSNAVIEAIEAVIGRPLPRPTHSDRDEKEPAKSRLDRVALPAAFAKFRASPRERFHVELRRQRAAQLRAMLADPEAVDVHQFDRDVWNHHTTTLLDGRPIELKDDDEMDEERRRSLLDALNSGRLELHGNYTWGTATRVFGAMFGEDVDKTAIIRSALRILVNPSLSPMQKYEQMLAVKGFGPNIVSGLVMHWHPTEFCIWNAVSKGNLQDLGLEFDKIESFQRAASGLRSELGAEDFIELDRFLYGHQVETARRTTAVSTPTEMSTPKPVVALVVTPTLAQILDTVLAEAFRIEPRMLRRYHVALGVRGFVILAGVSGTGKTWLSNVYARAIKAEYLLVSVAPNWTSNEDLLGYFNPLASDGGRYHHTPASLFLRRAAVEYREARAQERNPRPFHLVLDEMNLARVEHYFAKFLSALEVRQREGTATIELHPGESVELTPNLFVIGTVNIDETTHGFSDKVYDRAQLLELSAPRALMAAHVADYVEGESLLAVWDIVKDLAPFGFRVLDDVHA